MIRPEAGSWSGFRDSFGERAAAVDADGRSVERLRLFAAFTPAHQALAHRIARLDLDRPAVGRAIGLERDEPSARLILSSERVPGLRLSELLQTAVERSVVADLGAALFVMRRLLTIAESLQTATGVAQFSIAPERIVITPHARVVIVEPVLAAAAETVAIRSNDIAEIAVAGMSIMLGHLIDDAEHIDPLSSVLQEAAEVAAIRVGDRFSTALRLWFDRAIVADPTLSFPDFRQARLALLRIELPRESGCDASRRALKTFLGDLAIEPLIDPEAAALETSRIREIRAKQLARWKAIAAPDEEWIPVEDEALVEDEIGLISEAKPDEVVELPDELVAEGIANGPFAELEMAAAEEEPTEAAPAPSHRSWFRSMAQHLGLASAEPPPQTDIAAPPEDVVPDGSAEAEIRAEVAAPSLTPWTEPVLEEPATPRDEEIEEPLAEIAKEEAPEAVTLEAPPLDALDEPVTEATELVAASQLSDWSTPAVEPPVEMPESEPLVEREEESAAEITQDFAAPPIEEEEEEEEEEPAPSAWTEPLAEHVRTARDENVEQPRAEVAGEAPIETADYEPAAETLYATEAEPALETVEEPFTETAEPVASEIADWFTPVVEPSVEPPESIETQEESATEAAADFSDAPVEQDEAQPTSWVEPVSEPALSEDAHTSWIREISEQLGLARREEDVAEAGTETTENTTEAVSVGDETEAERITEAREKIVTWRPDEAAQFPESESFVDDEPEPADWIPPRELVFKPEDFQTVDTEVIQPPPAGTLSVEEHSEQPTSWATMESEPLREDASPAGAAMPFPVERVAHKDVAHANAADAQRTRPATQPATAAPRRRKTVVPTREWKRAAGTILNAGLSLSIVAGLVVAGRWYYARATTPGTVAVASIPAGSQVLVDGTPRGMTPLTLTLSPGNHVLELRRNGVARQFPITMTPGAELSHRLDWSTIKPTGTLVVGSTPPGARVIVDDKERGLTPLTIPDLPIGRRRVVIESSAGTVRRDVTVVADSRVTLNETVISGWIATFAPFDLQIYEGTRLIGTTEDGRIMVSPGRHELEFVNNRLGFRERRAVDVNPGATTAVNITTVVGTVRINAAPGAEVSIDGARVGETPVGDLRVPVGTHEIVLRHPQLGEQRMSVTVGASVPAEVNVDFTSR